MSRVTDAKLALWVGMASYGLPREHAESVLNALLEERARADNAEMTVRYDERHMDGDARRIRELGDRYREARAWAAWFAAERDWHEKRFDAQVAITEGIAKMYGAHMRRADDAEAALTRITDLHTPIETQWGAEGPRVSRCRHDGQLYPCATMEAVNG